VVSFFSLIDQSVSSLTLSTNGSPEALGPVGATFNPLTNTAVTVNSFFNTLSVIDPVKPARLNDANLYATRPGPIAVAVDPGSNIAVIANQTDNSVTVVSLGPIQPFSITETSPKIFVANSTLTQAPQPAAQTLTVLGKGLTCSNSATNLTVRLDGTPVQTFCVGTGDRRLTAIVPPSLLSTARRFAVDVADSTGDVTNAEDFLVEQSVDVSSPSCSSAPQPSGVAIDAKQNIAAVSLFGCNTLALINLATGTGQTVSVGTNPVGVAVIPRLHLAVVANNGSGNASVVDELGASVLSSPATDSGSFGASADEDTAEVAIANQVANTVTVVNAVTFATNTVSVGSGPVATGFNYANHQIGVANAGSNSASFGNAASSSLSTTFSINLPTSVAYDPVASDCNQTNSTAANNLVGCFLVNSSLSNNVEIIDPLTSALSAFSVGINPTAIAYNFRTSTLVSTNTLSHSVTVADFLAQKVRAVLPLPPALGIANSNRSLTGLLQFALDLHPFTNLAVIADTVNGRVLFIPVPR
jgi:DNA-binding beta-propeller fold protein YncE